MKKTFEFLIILIIFYGVYSAFQKAAQLLDPPLSVFWVVVLSLVASALILTLHSVMVKSTVSKKYRGEIKDLKKEVEQKGREVEDAFAIKKEVEEEAEKSIAEKNN